MRLLNYYACNITHLSRVRREFGHVSVACLRLRFSTGVRVPSGCVDEAFSIPVGNNGLVSLKVTKPPAASPFIKGSSRPQGPNVILYLPPGPLFQDPCENHLEDHAKSLSSIALPAGWRGASPTPGGLSLQHLLASLTAATVVTVNYRLGLVDEHFSSHSGATEAGKYASEEPVVDESQVVRGTPQPAFYQYPTPIHDTLAGLDWIQTHLRPTQLGIVGSHIGGSLALMLALTETQSVRAVAALEPVCDWPGLDEYCATEDTASMDMGADGDVKAASEVSSGLDIQKPKRQSKKKETTAPSDLVPLLKARERFFSSPERSFDAFASPILFLRSAGRDVPRTFPQYLTGPEYPVPLIKTGRQTTSAERHDAPAGSLWDRDVYPALETEEENDTLDASTRGPVVRRRKALSRWPPYGLDYGLSGRTWSGPGHGIGRLQMTLPWVRIFLREEQTSSSTPVACSGQSAKSKETSAENTVLARQADEMVSVMRRACFWGQEKGVGERIVTLSQVSTGDDDADSSDMPGTEISSWLKRVLDGPMDDQGPEKFG